MSHIKKAFGLILVLTASLAVFGQGVTTSSMSGLVTDGSGVPLPGANIKAVHQPTSTIYQAVTREDGRFFIVNMRVGGPYEVSATMAGFQSGTEKDVFVKLGETKNLTFKLQVESVSEELVVIGTSNPIINPNRTGAESNVPVEVIEELPTINRGVEDFARTNPYFTTTEFNGGSSSSLTVAGRNNRYNNIQIDGAVNNDLFGLAANGNPGGQAEAQPISLEAIQELQLVIAPFDVRQGGFTGGGVNAVTKTGTNSFSGAAFYYNRTDALIGDGPNDVEFGDFEETQAGVSVGGPIVKDKAFFFVSTEYRRRDQPTGWGFYENAGDGPGQNFNSGGGIYDDVQRFISILRDQYGYDPGPLTQQTRNTDSDNIFVRFDMNVNESNSITLRHNYVDAENLILYPDATTFNFPNNGYLFPSETNSTVLQWNGAFGSFFNEFRVGYQTIKDRRTGLGDPFPWIEIENVIDDAGNYHEFEVGTERFSTANSLDQDIIEITNDLTFFVGSHTITVGTHNEFFTFDNLFIRENFGAYQFNSLDDFANGWAEQYDYSYSADPSDPKKSAKFDARQLSLYVGDQWAVNPQLSLTLGLRVDYASFPDKPSANPDAVNYFGYKTDETPSNAIYSPRIGFNYSMDDAGKSQIRGGIGVFAGRSPFVWISNQYSNTGIEFNRISVRQNRPNADRHIDFTSDINNQPTAEDFTGVTPFTNEIDLIDPDFSLPQVLRVNLAYDRDIPFWGLIGTAEVIYTKNLKDILYQDLNLVQTGTAYDGRPTYSRRSFDDPNAPRFSNVIFLTNHSDGNNLNASLKVERPYQNGIYGFFSYAYGKAETRSDGTSSQAISNWRFNETQGDPNNPPIGYSDFDVRNRFSASLAYNIPWGSNGLSTNLSFFFEASSGRPYSTVFNGDFNGDGQFSNDLIYVPNGPDDVILDNTTWEDLDAYISSDAGLDSARGEIVKRNASREPWRRTLDFHASQDLKINRYKFKVTFDILNFINFIDSDKGAIYYANNNAIQAISYRGIDTATGKPIYRLQQTPDSKFVIDNLRSRWQAKLGLRFHF
ncbi:MAG: TonB-dependent receptor [Acidobacteria bacterium]|nr:TonB-dependent receptor [Acidobacteriota bacterium]